MWIQDLDVIVDLFSCIVARLLSFPFWLDTGSAFVTAPCVDRACVLHLLGAKSCTHLFDRVGYCVIRLLEILILTTWSFCFE